MYAAVVHAVGRNARGSCTRTGSTHFRSSLYPIVKYASTEVFKSPVATSGWLLWTSVSAPAPAATESSEASSVFSSYKPTSAGANTTLCIRSTQLTDRTTVCVDDGTDPSCVFAETLAKGSLGMVSVDVQPTTEQSTSVLVDIPVQTDTTLTLLPPFGLDEQAQKDCVLPDVSVVFEGKIEGSTHVNTRSFTDESADEIIRYDVEPSGSEASITADKLRGHTIQLIAPKDGPVNVGSLIESETCEINAGSVTVKKLLSKEASIQSHCGDIFIGAAYTQELKISSTSTGFPKIAVETLHGHAAISMPETANGSVTVFGVTGAVDVDAKSASVDVQFDSFRGRSTISAGGDVTVVIVPPIKCDIILATDRGAIISPGLTGLFRQQPATQPLVAFAGTSEEEVQRLAARPWFIRGNLDVKEAAAPLSAHTYDPDDPTAKPSTYPLLAHQQTNEHAVHGDAQSQPQSHSSTGSNSSNNGLGGSGKIRHDTTGVTGFYSPAVQHVGDAHLVIESRSGMIKLEILSWYEIMKRKAAAKPTKKRR
jgi:hypothetical protein